MAFGRGGLGSVIQHAVDRGVAFPTQAERDRWAAMQSHYNRPNTVQPTNNPMEYLPANPNLGPKQTVTNAVNAKPARKPHTPYNRPNAKGPERDKLKPTDPKDLLQGQIKDAFDKAKDKLNGGNPPPSGDPGNGDPGNGDPGNGDPGGGDPSGGAGGGAGGGHYGTQIDTSELLRPGAVVRPGLIQLPYGDMYDLTYDSDKILGIFNDATNAKYKALEEGYAETENQFLQNLVANQELAQTALRDTESQAVATGASRGMQAANQLAAILGLQQQSAEGALELSNEGNKLKNKKESEIAENSSKALETSNAVKNAIAQLDLQKYGYDTQWGIGQMDYNAALNDALAAIISAQINAAR